MRKTILFLFAIFCATMLCAQENNSRLNVRKLQLIPNDTEASRKQKKDANSDKCALIKIQTPNMDEADRNRIVIEADRGTFVYLEPAVGEIKIYLTEGVKTLVIKHPDYGKLVYDVPIKVEGFKTYEMVLEADKNEAAPKKIALTNAYVVLNLTPRDAIISIDGQFYTTNYIKLSVDEPHNLVVTHPLYHEVEKTIYASTKEKLTYDIKLAPAYGWLKITSKPESGAVVLINGVRKGVTPFKSDTLKSGEYEITLLKEMYENVTKSVMVRDNSTGDVEVVMKPNFAEVALTTDSQSDIYIDDANVGKGSWKGRLDVGNHVVEARKASHRSAMKSIDVVAGKNVTVTIPNPIPIYGGLDVSSDPQEATVYLDRVKIGETPFVSDDILIGSHALKFVKQGCAPLEKTIVVEEGKVLEVVEKLQTGKEISISTDRNGDKIFVDDNYIGDSPLKATLSFGEHEVKAIRNNKESKKKIIVTKTSEDLVRFAFTIGAINGVYSVSSNKKVKFSQGNLQYQASTKTWRFAENQWEIIGAANNNISSNYSGWIDLFGWGTSGNPTTNSTSKNEYGSFTDWGNNKISNGSGKRWRTLTREEWVYVFNTRNTSSGIRYAKATVDGVKGVILLPDDWNRSNYGLNYTNQSDATFSSNRVSQSDWQNKFESNGAVFLPAAGYRSGTSVGSVGSSGYYWSASYFGEDYARDLSFYDGYLSADYKHYSNYGQSVRLVCPAE